MTAYYTAPDTPGIVIVHDRRGWWHADISRAVWTKAKGSGELIPATHDEIEQAESIRPPDLGGRPPIGSPIQVRLPDDLLERIDQAAEKDGVTRAELIRRLLAAGLEPQ